MASTELSLEEWSVTVEQAQQSAQQQQELIINKGYQLFFQQVSAFPEAVNSSQLHWSACNLESITRHGFKSYDSNLKLPPELQSSFFAGNVAWRVGVFGYKNYTRGNDLHPMQEAHLVWERASGIGIRNLLHLEYGEPWQGTNSERQILLGFHAQHGFHNGDSLEDRYPDIKQFTELQLLQLANGLIAVYTGARTEISSSPVSA